ncbi:MAG: Rv0909 family putative TA system antitoxin, partial [Pseudonocardiales bacterium]
AAGPVAAQAKVKAAELAERAGELGAKGVSTLGESLDKVTGGKYSDKISAVTAKLEEKLDPDNPTAPPKA